MKKAITLAPFLEESKIDIQFLRVLSILYLAIIVYTYLISDPIAMRLGVKGYDDTFSTIDSFSIWSALLIAPIIEELLFRFHLSGQRAHAYFFLIPLIIVMFVFKTYWYIFLLGAILFLIRMWWEEKKEPGKKNLSTFLFYTIVIITSLIFASLHFINVVTDNETLAIFLVIMALTPAALLLSFIRYKKGLVYAMVFHCISNFITLFLNGLIYH